MAAGEHPLASYPGLRARGGRVAAGPALGMLLADALRRLQTLAREVARDLKAGGLREVFCDDFQCFCEFSRFKGIFSFGQYIKVALTPLLNYTIFSYLWGV